MKFRGDIEGLRAVAVLLVILAHLNVAGFSGGFIGVDVFFVISGFLITNLLILEHEKRASEGRSGFSIFGFYLRRVKRILPAAFVVVLTTVAAAQMLWNSVRAGRAKTDAWWALLNAANINEMRKATNYFENGLPHSPLQHYWSLAVEEQFYFVWPFVLLIALKAPLSRWISWNVRILICLSAIWLSSLWFSIESTATSPSWAYFHPFARGWELATGALLAAAMRQRVVTALLARRQVAQLLFLVGIAAIAFSAVVFDANTSFPGFAALLPVLGATTVIAAGCAGKNPLLRTIDNAPMRFVGRISYSMYLWHWPVILLMPSALPDLSGFVQTLLMLLMTVVLSIGSYYLVEQPFRRLGHANRQHATA